MSFKDLEAEIKAWADLEAYAKAHKEASEELKRATKRHKKAQKDAKKAGKHTGPLIPKRPAPTLERPTRTYKRVTIECRPIHHRKWGEPIEATFEVCTLSDAVAEVDAINQARAEGLSYDRLVCIVTFEK